MQVRPHAALLHPREARARGVPEGPRRTVETPGLGLCSEGKAVDRVVNCDSRSQAAISLRNPPTRAEVEAGCPVSFPACAASDACDAELTSALASDDKPDLTGKSDEFKNVIVCARW